MNPTKMIAFVACISFFTLSCKDNSDDLEVYNAVIIGTLLDSCNGNPIVGKEIVFIDAGSSGNIFQEGLPEDKLGVYTTDENGKFTVNLQKRLAANFAYITTTDNRILFFGEVLENDVDMNDIGNLYLESMKRPIRLKLTIQNDEWNTGQKVQLSQFKTDKSILNDSAINTSTKRGIMYFDWEVYFFEKRSDDVATGKSYYRGVISASSGSKKVIKEITVEDCDTASVGEVGLHLTK
jgi:hypothetical protein